MRVPIFIRRKTMIEFCEWSKQAEWMDRTKQMFIKNKWRRYFAEFLKQRKNKQ